MSLIQEFDKLKSTHWWPIIGEFRSIIERIDTNLPAKYIPYTRDIFRPFRLTKPSKLKVIMIGQDPYPKTHRVNINGKYINVPDADGLAFSAGYTWRYKRQTPASLNNILNELHRTHGNVGRSGNLKPWCNAGVLLLNSALTKNDDDNLNHYKIWRPFISSILSALYTYNTNLIVVLVGSKAKSILRDNDMTSCDFPLVHAPHPSPLNKVTPFYGSDIFKKIDEELQKLDIEPIKWNLN